MPCELDVSCPPNDPAPAAHAHLTSSARGPGLARTAQQLAQGLPLASQRTAPQTHDLRGGPGRIHGQTTSAYSAGRMWIVLPALLPWFWPGTGVGSVAWVPA